MKLSQLKPLAAGNKCRGSQTPMIDHDRTTLTERQWVVRNQDVQYDSYHALRLAGCTAVGFSCCLLRRLGNRN
jgi:hypothetical protein